MARACLAITTVAVGSLPGDRTRLAGSGRDRPARYPDGVKARRYSLPRPAGCSHGGVGKLSIG